MTGAMLLKQMGHKAFKRPPTIDRFQRPGETEVTKGSYITTPFDQQRDVQLTITSALFSQRFCSGPPTLGGVGPTIWHGGVHPSNAPNTPVNR